MSEASQFPVDSSIRDRNSAVRLDSEPLAAEHRPALQRLCLRDIALVFTPASAAQAWQMLSSPLADAFSAAVAAAS